MSARNGRGGYESGDRTVDELSGPGLTDHVTAAPPTLTEFLLARIAEDEDEAREMGTTEYYEGGWTDAREEKVLAECEAKRRIVERCAPSHCGSYLPPGPERDAFESELGYVPPAHYPEEYAAGCDGCAAAESVTQADGHTLEILATVYADHPEFRGEWRA